MKNLDLYNLTRERNKIELAIDVISRMNINNKTSLIKTLSRVKAVKEQELLRLNNLKK